MAFPWIIPYGHVHDLDALDACRDSPDQPADEAPAEASRDVAASATAPRTTSRSKPHPPKKGAFDAPFATSRDALPHTSKLSDVRNNNSAALRAAHGRRCKDYFDYSGEYWERLLAEKRGEVRRPASSGSPLKHHPDERTKRVPVAAQRVLARRVRTALRVTPQDMGNLPRQHRPG